MKKIYDAFCNIEELICGAILCIIVALAFITAVARCVSHPISWTVEISQFFLSWLAFLGADMALRHGRVLGVDYKKIAREGTGSYSFSNRFSDSVGTYFFCEIWCRFVSVKL